MKVSQRQRENKKEREVKKCIKRNRRSIREKENERKREKERVKEKDRETNQGDEKTIIVKQREGEREKNYTYFVPHNDCSKEDCKYGVPSFWCRAM